MFQKLWKLTLHCLASPVGRQYEPVIIGYISKIDGKQISGSTGLNRDETSQTNLFSKYF